MQIGKLQLDNRFFLAPLAGISNLPFRLINKGFGCALVHSEMISAQGLTRNGKKTKQLLLSDKDEKPLSCQLFGHDRYALRNAAILLEEELGADIIDLNMGCPVKKVVRNGSGCALLADPRNVHMILAEMRKAVKVPFTIKMRLGMESGSEDYLEVAKIAEDEGVDAICLHPRTRSQLFKGDIDLDALKRLKESVSIPVIGSGNLFTADDAHNMLDKTGCDAVMIARGARGNPFIFRDLIDGRKTAVTNKELLSVIKKHVEYFLRFYDKAICHREMKKHMIWYTKGIPGSATFRKSIVSTKDIDTMMILLEEYLRV